MAIETWELWYPNAAATGLSFARCRLDSADIVLVHAAPDALRVEVRAEDGSRRAFADQLRLEGDYYPMTRLTLAGASVVRTDGWPEAADIGRPVLLPGGEVGILTAWWNAADGSEWRWSVDFYNRK